MANGEAHRQEVGVISSGSYQSSFLCDLSDEETESYVERKSEKTCERKFQGRPGIAQTSCVAGVCARCGARGYRRVRDPGDEQMTKRKEDHKKRQ